jgi:DNA segregation ATPase FtsK/SpoIIIE-like protein
MILIGVIVLGSGTFGVVVYKKKAAAKKRYKITVDYSELPKAGPRTAYVGIIAETTNKTYFDLDLFQVHTLVAGASGSGKTIVAQDLVEEALLKGTAVMVFDPTGQWTGFLRKCQDKKLLDLYPKFGMKKSDAKAFNGNVHQVTNPRELLDLKKYMKPGEIHIFVTNKLDTRGNEIFVSNAIKEVFHANLPEARQLRFLMVYDGIHSLLPKYGGSGKVFVQVERATREFRKWGVGLLLLSQVLSDFPPQVLANINTEVQMRTRDEGDLNRIKEEYGEDVLKSVVKASVGTGMVENSSYNKGKPYFVSFRPIMHSNLRLTDEDLENYNKYNAIMDDMEYQIEQLEKEGLDVFDLKLELKLSQDKVKSGNFNMVGIYSEGLKSRLIDLWKKVGKQPKKREIKLVSDDELEEEVTKAEEESKNNEVKEEKASEKEKNEEVKKNEQPEEEVKKKEAKQEEKVEEKKENGRKVEETNDFDKVKRIYDDALNSIKNNDIGKAKSLYSEVGKLYKTLPPEQKKEAFNLCINLQKEVKGK